MKALSLTIQKLWPRLKVFADKQRHRQTDRQTDIPKLYATVIETDRQTDIPKKQRKKCILDGQTPCCPVCGLTLRTGEIESHFAVEMDRLERLVRGGRKSRDPTPQGRKTLPSPLCGRRGKESPSSEIASQSRYDTYVRIKCNRQARLSARTRTKKKRPTEETICPICTEKLIGTPEELNAHVELCLKRRTENGNEDEPVDVEGDSEQYEEYEWAGQTRIRVSTMLQGGYAGSGFQTSSSKKLSDEEGDLNVDGDDSEQYGKPHEVDIIPCSSEEPKEMREREALRGAMLHGSSTEVVEALKAKLREKEEILKGHKCLICMEVYRNPLTSIQCWHVHCEECWMKTLGAKKLCPQCNMITAATDLRRIYL
ncbi:hypothetical protein FSP39_019844 [Pinctada imbricata]|uniref:RING-type domain-containing protein n=1 Tax=Pinctada imbricata TaxID=66713 RepID=A0AA89BL26_PINIB|nr:hypothetical protein FSP39_019844 [Pinctada imbricata]